MNFFNLKSLENHAPLSLEDFASALNDAVTTHGLKIINGADMVPVEFELEMRAQEDLLQTSMHTTQTNLGPIYSSDTYDEGQPLRLLNTQEVKNYIYDIGRVALIRKKTNCFTLAAACFLLAEELTKNKCFQDIEVEVCQFTNWNHVFIKLKHPNNKVLYFDPWQQQFANLNPNIPNLIETSQLNSSMDSIVFAGNSPITHNKILLEFDNNTIKLGTIFKKNPDYSFNYRIVCSTNPNYKSMEESLMQRSEHTESRTCIIS